MSKGLFITGTDTDIGKTYVTALIVKKLRDHGFNAGYYKAALSGAEENNGILTAGDADFVCRTAQIPVNPNDCVSYIYKNAYSPHLAAAIEGNPPEMDKIKSDFRKATEKYDYITVEGSGGIICPIRYDKHIFLEDIIKELDLTALIVADSGLGTINSTVLTIEYMKSRNIEIQGIIFNNYHKNNIMDDDNIKMIEELTGINSVAKVSTDDNELNIDIGTLTSLYKEV